MKKTILIVEDIAINREILSESFKDEYRVLEAENGLEALQILSEEKSEIALIILDVYMPVMDGFELLERIRRNRLLEKIPVIVATELNDKASEIKALELGAVDFIGKPYNIRVIKQRVQNMIFMTENISYRYMTELDSLTELYNRETFYRKTKEMFRENKDKLFYIYCLNIDRFKVINDLFGTNEGDNLLNFIAQSIKRNCPNDAIIGRLSADNFAISCLYKEKFDSELIEKINNDLKSFPLKVEIIVRIGSYPVNDISLPVHIMCDRANLAISNIKENYSKRTAVYKEFMRDSIIKEQEIINSMNDAIIKNQFVVFYQPKINIVTNKIIGSEALVRWIQPQKGMISPGIFIPIFEKNGFISTLDRHVWELVCIDIRKWLDDGKKVPPVSINVSRAELYNNDLCDVLMNLVNKYRIPINLLQLEITESAYTESPSQLIEIVENLREKGFVILMDDFGSGYSSLNTLKDVPVDVLKIDLKFLSNMEGNIKAIHILKSIVQMSKRLNLDVIAEGVETKQQANFLKSIGCIKAQGYLYSKPIPKDEFDNLEFKIADSDDDDVSSFLNIDDIMSKLYIEGETEWYRSAVLQLKASISEYNVKTDTLVIFDVSKNDNNKLLEKIEIPNFKKFLLSGRYVYKDDIEKYMKYFFSNNENLINIRIKDLRNSNVFNWYEMTSRVFFDDNEAHYIISVFRNINKEKINELIIDVFKTFLKSKSISEAFKNSFYNIGETFLIDIIDVIVYNQNEPNNSKRFIWSKNDEFNEMFIDCSKYINQKLECEDDFIVYKNDDECNEFVNEYFKSKGVKSIALKTKEINEFCQAVVIFSSFNKRGIFGDFQKDSLNYIALCIFDYLKRSMLKI